MLDTAVDVLAGRPFAVITGAGLSTDSGIPDYRGDGAPRANPMTFQRFLESPEARQRYWAGSQVGWRRFAAVQPNDGHRAIARMQRAGLTTGIVTQNVDDLHERGGAQGVVHLHGDLSIVRCLGCGHTMPRREFAAQLAALNPWLEATGDVHLKPDGDVEVAGIERVRFPDCPICGGILKPGVVFFGETVPVDVFDQAAHAVQRADAVLVAGSSLAVNSAVRLLEIARRKGAPIVIVNRGPTRWDHRAMVRLEGGASELLTGLADALGA